MIFDSLPANNLNLCLSFKSALHIVIVVVVAAKIVHTENTEFIQNTKLKHIKQCQTRPINYRISEETTRKKKTKQKNVSLVPYLNCFIVSVWWIIYFVKLFDENYYIFLLFAL